MLVGGAHPTAGHLLRGLRLLRSGGWSIANGFTGSALSASALLLDRCQQRVQFQRDDAFQFVGQDLSSFGDPFVFSKDQTVCTLDRSDRRLGNSGSSHPDQVDRADFRIVASASEHERRDVGGNSAAAADKGKLADRREVMHDAVARHDRSIMDVNVPAEQHAIDQKRVVEDMAVVSDVRVRHQHVAVADAGPMVFLLGSATDSDAFAKEVVVADFDSGVGIGSEADILRLATDHTVRPEPVSLADNDFALHNDIAVKRRAVADRDVGTNDAERADFDIVADPG
jgi:hypothetical protein